MSTKSTYAYRARDTDGAIVTGSMVASSAEEVGARLRTDGKFVVMVDDKPLSAARMVKSSDVLKSESAKRVRREDVISFAQQLSVMLETGVPLSEALDSFCRQSKSRDFRVVLTALRDEIYSGETFSASMEKWPRVFPRMMISLMKASEASGTMATMLGRIGDYLERERRTVRQIKGALAYPMFMIGAGLLLTVFLMIFILPRFATIYERRSAALPTPTRVLLGISDFLTTQYMFYAPALVVGGVGLMIFLSRPVGRRTVDWLKLNFPVLRNMFGQLYIARAARTMATLLAAGVNLLDIIDICRGVTNNVHFNRLWDRMEIGVRDGKQINDAVDACPYIPPNVASMISSGERSGRLGEVMERIAGFSDQELETAVKQVTAYIEPVMVIFMGVVVGGVAMALLLPIFKMGNVMAGG